MPVYKNKQTGKDANYNWSIYEIDVSGSLNEPCGFFFIFPQLLQNASFLRTFGKIINPPMAGLLGIAERIEHQ